MNAIDRAWAAGLIDGEGSIQIAGTGHGMYQARMDVGMTHKSTVFRIQRMFGVGVVRERTRPGNRRNCFVWTVASKKLIYVLRLVLPYLHTRKKQAVYALRYAERVTGRKPLRLRPGERRWRDQMAAKCKILNKVGRS